MIPFGSETVTLYHRVREIGPDGRETDRWERILLKGCSWREKQAQQTVDGAVLHTAQTLCRIPAGFPQPSVGDVLLLGDVVDQPATSREVALLLEVHRIRGAFRAAVVSDHSRACAPLAHYAVRGDRR